MSFKQCKSIKNKNNPDIQCHRKCLENNDFCGLHLKSKILYNLEDHMNKLKINDDNLDNDNLDNNEKIIKNDDKNKIYELHELFEKISNNESLSVFSLRNSIKNTYLKKIINTKESKKNIIVELKNIIKKERYYLINLQNIILIQSYIRKWSVLKRKKSCNNLDILTFESIYDIPIQYFYLFNDLNTNKKYGFDIRSLLEILKSDNPSCPYTLRPYIQEEIDNINKFKDKLLQNGVDLNIEKIILTTEEEIDMSIKDLFYQINSLDNYTDHDWFKNLSLYQLKNLYFAMEDIWNYRSMMNLEAKKKILSGNKPIFTVPKEIIKNLKDIQKLRKILIYDFKRLINEGINRDEKKLGSMLLLTGLVEVSVDAANALPHLIQQV